MNDAKTGRWVLILDNLDDDEYLHTSASVDPDSLESGQSGKPGRSIWSYFSRSLHGSIIITSRSKSVASKIVEHHDIIPVEAMDKSHAISLFEKKLGEQANREGVIQLSTALEFMPLAIVQAAAYIKQRAPRESVKQYLERFRKGDRQKTSLLDYEEGHLRRDPEAKNSILVTWQISFDHIRRKRPSATDLLSLMSFFDRQGIPDTLLQSETETKGTLGQYANSKSDENDAGDTESASLQNEIDKFEDDICMLRDYSMVSVNADGKNFEMHRLVQLAIQEWLKAHTQLEIWKEHFIRRLDSKFPTPIFENWKECQLLFAHVQCAVAQRPYTEASLSKWASLLHKAASFAWSTGDFINSERMAKSAINARKNLLGPESEETLSSSDILGLAYRLGGQWKKAEELQVQVMETRKRVLGLEHPRTLTSLSNLASTYRNQGRWKEAEELQVQVMETSKRVLGLEHPKTLASLANLASTYWNQGRWKEAEELEVQVMEARKRVLGLEHPDTLASTNNLAWTLKSSGQDKVALQMMDECARLLSQQLGPDHPYTLSSISTINEWHRVVESSSTQLAKAPVGIQEDQKILKTFTGISVQESGTGRRSKRAVLSRILFRRR